MAIEEHKLKLIQHFVDGTLKGEAQSNFKTLFENDEDFAAEAEKHLMAEAALTAIADEMQQKTVMESTVNKGNVRRFIPWLATSAVAAIAIIIILLSKVYTYHNAPPKVLVETDTLYLPKNEYFKLPTAIAAEQYVMNADMEHLVELTNVSMRDDVQNIKCLPTNNAHFKLGAHVEFALPAFKPNTYGFTLLAFYEHIQGIDTIYTKQIKLNDPSIPIYNWQPKTKGMYYWMVHVQNNTDPYVVRRLRVD